MTTTPPLNPPLPPHGTPIHTRSSTTGCYGPKYEDRKGSISRLADEMIPFIVGPISAAKFLEDFLPLPSGSSVPEFTVGMFAPLIETIRASSVETEWYNVFVSSLYLFSHVILLFQNQIISPHVGNLAIVNSSRLSDEAPHGSFAYSLKPDCSVYTTGNNPATGNGPAKLKFSLIDFVIEFKTADPFVNDPIDNGELNPFVRHEGSFRAILGQIIAYATAILNTQYRTHVFMVLVAKEYARLLRWDHGGVIVTEPILFNRHSFLFDFFVRYNIVDHEARGHDSTVSTPTESEIERAKYVVNEFTNAESFLVVTMPHQNTARRFIIRCPGGPVPAIPVGRWTRSSVAYDIQEGRRVLLKDSWRVLLKGIEPEGDIYCRLHDKQVPNISSCLLAGDVGSDTYHKSQTHEVLGNGVPRCSCWKLTPHRHYRMILGVVGRKLEEFKCTWELVNAMYAALKGKMAIFLAFSTQPDLHYSSQGRLQRWRSS